MKRMPSDRAIGSLGWHGQSLKKPIKTCVEVQHDNDSERSARRARKRREMKTKKRD